MNIEKIQFTNNEIQQMSDSIDEIFAKESSNLTKIQSQKLLDLISNYLQRLNQLENQILSVSSILKSTMLEQATYDQSQQRKMLRNKLAEKSYLQENLFDQMQTVFGQGYVLLNHLHEYITNETIQYHVAVERGKTKESMIYQATEQEIVNNLQFDYYRLSSLLLNSETLTLDYTMRYRATVKRAQQEEEPISLPKKGSTLWSKGYRVFQVAKQYNNGINFGHFLEAYYYFGGNKGNRQVRNFDSENFYRYMRVLMNSKEFYRGGDADNIQLKSNTATITSIHTIKKALENIVSILSEERGNKYKKIKDLLTSKKMTKSFLEKAAKEIEMPEELRKQLAALDKK